MIGEKNLNELIANMEPVLNKGEYVFATVASATNIPRALVICEMKEAEGITLVLAKKIMAFGFEADMKNPSAYNLAKLLLLSSSLFRCIAGCDLIFMIPI